jgi:hypothetical protein
VIDFVDLEGFILIAKDLITKFVLRGALERLELHQPENQRKCFSQCAIFLKCFCPSSSRSLFSFAYR